MNKVKFKNFILVLLLLVSIVASAVLFVSINKNDSVTVAKAQMAEVDGNTLQSSYELGTVLEIPKINLSYGESNFTSDSHVVIFPDGRTFSTNSVKLDMTGNYRIKFKATVNGNTYYAYENFLVHQGFVSFSGDRSKSDYGKNELTDVNGLEVSLAMGETATFNEVIDLKKYDINHSFIGFKFLPQAVGRPDAHIVYLTLTDIYNAENKVVIRMSNWSDMGTRYDGWTLMDAKAPGQEWTSSVNPVYSKRGEYGHGWYACECSMVGRLADGTPDYGTISFYMDYEDRAFVTDKNHYGSKYMVDLDNPFWYDLATEKLWDGFTTGEVRVSLSAANYRCGSVNMLFTSFGDADLSQSAISYQEDPLILINKGDNTQEIPCAIKGTEYKIFDAVAYDVVGNELDVVENVFYNLADEPIACEIKDGKFMPKKTGVYTIVYKATDKFGNTSLKNIDIQAVDTAAALEFDLDGAVTSIPLGVESKLFNAVIHNNDSKYGAISFDIELTNKQSGDKYEISDENPLFMPFIDGEYEMTVTMRDYCRTATKTFEFVVESGIYFVDQPQLPDYMVENLKYQFPVIKAIKVANTEKIDVPVSVYVEEFSGDESLGEKKVTEQYVAAANVDKVTIRYKAEDGSNTEVLTYENIRIVDAGYTADSEDEQNIDMADYFVTTLGQIKTQSYPNYLMFEIACNSTGERPACFDFVNLVQVYNFKTSFNVYRPKEEGDPLYDNCLGPIETSIYLKDCNDPSLFVKFTFARNGSSTNFYVNDDLIREVTLPYPFTGESSKVFSIEYNNKEKSVIVSGEHKLFVNSYFNGEEFNGFKNNTAKLSYEVIASTIKNSAILLYDINNQSFSNINEDTMSPQLILPKKVVDFNPGETVELCAPIIADVLDVNYTVKLTVKDENGNFVTADDGTVLDGSCDALRSYEITKDNVEEYVVTYEAIDSFGNRAQNRTFITNAKKNYPTLSIDKTLKEAVVGATVKLAQLNISDKDAQEYDVEIYVNAPNGRIYSVEDASFKFEVAGNYTVYYYVFSSDYISVLSYDILVRNK